MSILSKLAEIRRVQGLSQNDLIRLSGVSRSSLTKYESGEKNINKATGETLFKLAKVLNCKMEDLLEFNDI